MNVIATSPVKGKNPGESLTVAEGEGRWLIANGYARQDDDGDHLFDSGVEAAVDPTLAANREPADTENVAEDAEFKPGSSSVKIVPGDRSTNVKASNKVLAEQGKELDRVETVNETRDEAQAPQQVAENRAAEDREPTVEVGQTGVVVTEAVSEQPAKASKAKASKKS